MPIISGGGGGGTFGQSGAASPVGVVTPAAIGGLYRDTTHGTLYIATGATSASWEVVGGVAVNIGDAPGVSRQGTNAAVVGGLDKDTQLNGNGAALTDAYTQWNGSGYRVGWQGSGTDGDQFLVVYLGGGTTTFRADGVLDTSVAKGIIFPTANPHIVGAWWDNAGVLTKSAG